MYVSVVVAVVKAALVHRARRQPLTISLRHAESDEATATSKPTCKQQRSTVPAATAAAFANGLTPIRRTFTAALAVSHIAPPTALATPPASAPYLRTTNLNEGQPHAFRWEQTPEQLTDGQQPCARLWSCPSTAVCPRFQGFPTPSLQPTHHDSQQWCFNSRWDSVNNQTYSQPQLLKRPQWRRLRACVLFPRPAGLQSSPSLQHVYLYHYLSAFPRRTRPQRTRWRTRTPALSLLRWRQHQRRCVRTQPLPWCFHQSLLFHVQAR
jgi:hypothetical protein